MDVDWSTILNVALSGVAIVLSITALFSARKDRRLDVFAKAEEYLLTERLQEARRLIYEAKQRGSLPGDEESFRAIMLGLSSFNTVAKWSRLGLVEEDWLVEEWHHHLREMRQVYESMLAHRAAWHRFNPWPDLDNLISAAEAYTSDRSCCSGPPLAERAARTSTPLLRRLDATSLQASIPHELSRPGDEGSAGK